MKMLDFKWIPAAVMAATLITACGGRTGDPAAAGSGGSSGVSPAAVVEAPGDISTSVAALLNYARQLLNLDANGDPVNVNATALAVDDSGEPDPVTF